MKALVVDDSRAMRMILSQMLKDCGFEVIEAKHGRDALACLQSNPETILALIDWNMPEMNGIELLEAIRDDDRYSSLRRIMVTTESELVNISRAMAAGASEYIMKPFTASTIQDKLRTIGVIRGHGYHSCPRGGRLGRRPPSGQ